MGWQHVSLTNRHTGACAHAPLCVCNLAASHACATRLAWHTGTRVRRVFADRLEARYEREGESHYMFSIDESEFLVDATRCGNKCRFINHSCGCARRCALHRHLRVQRKLQIGQVACKWLKVIG
jgi:hypothetical protein